MDLDLSLTISNGLYCLSLTYWICSTGLQWQEVVKVIGRHPCGSISNILLDFWHHLNEICLIGGLDWFSTQLPSQQNHWLFPWWPARSVQSSFASFCPVLSSPYKSDKIFNFFKTRHFNPHGLIFGPDLDSHRKDTVLIGEDTGNGNHWLGDRRNWNFFFIKVKLSSAQSLKVTLFATETSQLLSAALKSSRTKNLFVWRDS